MEGPIVVFRRGVALHKKATRAKKDATEKGVSSGLEFESALTMVDEGHPDAEGLDRVEFSQKHAPDLAYRTIQHRIAMANGEEEDDYDEEREEALADHVRRVDEARKAFYEEKAAEDKRLAAERLAKAQVEAADRERNADCVHTRPSHQPEVAQARMQERRTELAAIRIAAGGPAPMVRRYGEEKTLADKLASLIKVMDAAQLQLTVEFIEREWPRLHA